MNLHDALAAGLAPGAVTRADAAWQDLCRFDLGTPVAVVRPTSTAQVAHVVATARQHRTPVVPVGQRTAYWRPLHVHGAIALELDGLRGAHLDDGFVRVGAGEPVRPLDVALRQAGDHLPLHPDAYGETSLGALVAMACSSGIGMARGGIDRWITGLTVVTGTGDVLHTGTASAFRDTPAFLRLGLPDATGLFLGAEGTLGVITEVCLARVPAPWRVRLHADAGPDPRQVAHAGRDLASRGLVDTVRLRREIDPATCPTFAQATWRLDCWVLSTLDPEDALERARWAADLLDRTTGLRVRLTSETEAARQGLSPDYDDTHWNGPMGTHARLGDEALFSGMDVNAPWASLDDLLGLADRVARDQAERGGPMTRTALYLAADFVNLGMHTAFLPDDGTVAWARAQQQAELTALAALPVVPYRLGRAWPAAMVDKLDPAWRAWWRDTRDRFDPDGILQPGHPLAGLR